MGFEEFQAELSEIWAATAKEVALKTEVITRSSNLTESLLKQTFDDNLRRAHAAFIQCYRNHAVVVDKEVTRLRKEITTKLEEMYGEKITILRNKTAEDASLVLKYKKEVSFLKGLVTGQENIISSMKQQQDPSKMVTMKEKVRELEKGVQEHARLADDYSFQLTCSTQLVEQLRNELTNAGDVLMFHTRQFNKERKELEQQLMAAQVDSKQKEYAAATVLKENHELFQKFKKKTEKELFLQHILNTRRSEALEQFVEERESLNKTRSKPTPRIGDPDNPPCPMKPEDNLLYHKYDVLPSPGRSPARVYRIDAMGMNQSWKETKESIRRGRPHRFNMIALPSIRDTQSEELNSPERVLPLMNPIPPEFQHVVAVPK